MLIYHLFRRFSKITLLLSLVVISFLLSACAIARRSSIDGELPAPEREFRAAWVATVANINWPSQPGLPAAEQKKEALALLDLLADNHFNAVILQVRPQGDALYQSLYEPWSYYLSGEQGKPPLPYYDPLEFWIEEAHKRGLELHAWLNPYRVHHPSGGPISEYSMVRQRPELALQLEGGYWWLDPSLEGTREHSTKVVLDIVRRYDVDGIHFDDYFYPYPSYNGGNDFPDDASWQAYQAKGGNLSRSDWRRESVNIFIKKLYKALRREKPHVKFGLSPFGIWRPNHPASIQGFDQHEKLYADARLWLNKGWIDYWTPQLYWTINQVPQSFPVLLGWWKDQNKKNRHLWPGIRLARDTTVQAMADEVINQIMVTRGMIGNGSGNIHWSIGPLVTYPGLTERIAEGPYRSQALAPATPWLDKKPPKPPSVQVERQGSQSRISWTTADEADVFRWVVYYQQEGSWHYQILNHDTRSMDFLTGPAAPVSGAGKTEELPPAAGRVAVVAVDRMGNESAATFVDLKIGQ